MTATFHVGDAIQIMNQLPAKSVDLVLTSPPFLALRSYLPADHPDKKLEGGSQATPVAYIDWLVDVVEACDRVLASHGSMCIELGDTYAGSNEGGGDAANSWRMAIDGERDKAGQSPKRTRGGWPLPKSLSLIPELFRLTLVYGTNPLTGRTTERWRLRNVIRWVRPNPPVGALGDKFRPATSELMVFCKSAKRYFDLDAVRTAHTELGASRQLGGRKSPTGGDWTRDEASGQNPAGAPPLDWWNVPLVEGAEPTKMGPKAPQPTAGAPYRPGRKPVPDRNPSHGWGDTPQGRENLNGPPPLDWWNIPPGGYTGAHYAVWPPELLIRPIKAMCPEKVCRQCGEPRRRMVEREQLWADGSVKDVWAGKTRGATGRESEAVGRGSSTRTRVIAERWSDCICDVVMPGGAYKYRPGLVLDPFAGSGTTLAVATGHGRDAIGIDLDERNYELALQRVGPLVLEKGEVAA